MKPGEKLRFPVGTRVECNVGEWQPGTIVAHWWRDAKWPEGKIVPYQIKLDFGPTIFAPKDHDAAIRKVTGLLAMGQIPCTILTGFLGAGKTTLLNYILTAQHGKKYAIIENEFGEVSIDNQLVDQAVGKLDTVESISVLDNGCLCCTVREDLVTALKNIVEKVEKRHAAGVKDAMIDGILIETTGMADPGPIINTFGKDATVSKYCKIDGVLTVVDCKHFLTQLHRERPPDAVNEPAQQVGFADKLLLNKIDACSRELVEETKQCIHGINAFVPIIECCLAKEPDKVPLGELLAIEAFDTAKLLTSQNEKAEVNLVCTDMEPEQGSAHGEGHGGGHGGGHESDLAHGSGHGGGGHEEAPAHADGRGHGHGHTVAHGKHDTDVKSMVLERAGAALDMRKFQQFLGVILEERSVDLYRYKGVLAAKSSKSSDVASLYILQGVHDMPELTFSGQWPEHKPVKTQVVLIGRKLDRERYMREFAECFD